MKFSASSLVLILATRFLSTIPILDKNLTTAALILSIKDTCFAFGIFSEAVDNKPAY